MFYSGILKADRIKRNKSVLISLAITVLIFIPPSVSYSQSASGSGGPLRESIGSTKNSISLSFFVPEQIEYEYSPEGERISLFGFTTEGEPGEPMLPRYTFSFLLPEDVVDESINVQVLDASWEPVPGRYEVQPAPPLAPAGNADFCISWGDKDAGKIKNGRDTGIYEKDAFFPGKPIISVQHSQYRKWKLLYVVLVPVRYNPVAQRIQLLRSGTIQINFEPSSKNIKEEAWKHVTPDNIDKLWKRLSPRLENPKDRDLFYPFVSPKEFKKTKAITENYIIVTTNHIRLNSTKLGAFMAHKQSSPYNFQVRLIIEDETTEDHSHYVSGDTAKERSENIRTWLKNNIATIEYVLLVGDPDPTDFNTNESIPMMECYPKYNDFATTGIVPTDMYFAELSGDWDKDGDGHPGEYRSFNRQDFQSGGIDTDCEVGVGRIPYYGSISDLDNILQKIITYESATGSQDWRKKVLIPAAILNHAPQDANEDGDANDTSVKKEYSSSSDRTLGDAWGESMKSLAGGAGYFTYTLYEKEGVYSDGTAYPTTTCNLKLTKENLKSVWKSYYGFVTWLGHGSQTGVTRVVWEDDDWSDDTHSANDKITQYTSEIKKEKFWESSDCGDLNDEFPSIVFEGSCNNATPENSGNQAYSLLKNGAIGTFACTRVSYYSLGSWSLGSWGDLRSHGYKILDHMVKSREMASDALNHNRNYFTVSGKSSWWNMIVINLYGPPALTQLVLSNYPDEPTNPGATNLSQHQIRWTWQDNSSNETGFRVYAGSGNTAPNTVTHTTSANVQHWDHPYLSANTKHSMRVSAYNSFYESLKTNKISAYTLIEPVSGLNFPTINQNNIEVKASNTPSNLTQGSSGLKFSNTTKVDDSGWHHNNNAWNSTGLSPNTNYDFEGVSRNAVGTQTTPFSTSKYTAIEPVSGVVINSVNQTSISVKSSNTPSNLSSGSSGLGYTKSPGYAWPTTWQQNNNSYSFLYLSPNTQYSFKGWSRNGDKLWAAASSSTSKYTLANMPTAPTVYNPTKNTLDVQIGLLSGNPGSTLYAIEISPALSGGKWIQANGTAGSSAVYQTPNSWGTNVSVTVKGLNHNTTYKFRTTAKNGDGVTAGPGPWGQGTTLNAPPGAPSNPGASWIGHYGITWTWQDNSDNESGFNIYACQGATAPSTINYKSPVNSTSWSQYCTVNKQYAFQVSAYNNGGESAKTSNLARYTLIENVLGLNFKNVTPTGIDVSSKNAPTRLTAGSSGLKFDNVTMGTTSGWQQNNTPWSSTGLSPNVQYTFTGVSRNGDASVMPSYTAKKYTLPNPPTMPLLSRPTATTIDIAIGTGDGNPFYTQYAIEIYQTPVGLSGYVQLNGTVKPQLCFMTRSVWGTTCVTGLTPSSTYCFHAVARNGDWDWSAASPIACQTTKAGGITPSQPVNPGTGIINETGIQWTWTDTSATEDGFTVFTGPNPSEPTKLSLEPPNSEEHIEGGLSPNTPYCMQVASYNEHGPSDKTSIINAFTYANTPLAPNVGSPDETTLDVSIGMSDGNSSYTLYAIQVSPLVGGNSWVQSDGSVGASADFQTSPTWGTTTVTGLSPSTLYTFNVTAKNGDGVNTSAGPGGSATTLALNSPPTAAPSNPGAESILTDSIRWTWQDNSSNEDGFKVYAGEGATAPGTVTGIAGENEETWDHTGLSPNTRYAMQVSATNSNGDSNQTNNLAKYSAIEEVSDLEFSGVTSSTISVRSFNTPSNLSLGSSGLLFTIDTEPPSSSPWRQNNSYYAFTGLSPNTCYTLTGKSRNADGMESPPFPGVMKYTLAAMPTAPLVTNPDKYTLDVAIGPYDGNTSETLYAIQITPGVGGNTWVQSDGSLGATDVYQSTSAWGTVTVTGLSLDSFYTFTAVAKNEEGILTGPGPGATASTLPNLPAAPSDPGATDITEEAILWTWTDNSSNEVGFKVFAGSGDTAPTDVTFQTGFDAVFWNQDGLSPNSPYTMEVCANNAAGDSAKTPYLTRYTAIEQVSALNFTGVTADSISVKSAHAHSNLTAGVSGLFFSNLTQGTNSGWKQNNNEWVCASLSPNAEYMFAGKSRNGDGVETDEYTESKYTLANVPKAPCVAPISMTSLVLRIDSSDGNPQATLYAIRISPNTDGKEWVQADGALGTAPIYQTADDWGCTTVTGLNASTSYTFKATARNGEGIDTSTGPGKSCSTLSQPITGAQSTWTRYE